MMMIQFFKLIFCLLQVCKLLISPIKSGEEGSFYSISPENDYATTIFKLRELEIFPYLGITFGS